MVGAYRLYARINHAMEEEFEHVDALIERTLFLEARPDFGQQVEVRVGKYVKEMLKNDLDLEYGVSTHSKR